MSLVRTGSIKNLSIALEALSRIPKSEQLSAEIETLLWKEINEEKYPPYTVRPAATTSDDEIPF